MFETDKLEREQAEYVEGLFDFDKFQTQQHPEEGIWEVPWIVERWN
jgi:hypothetical protein